MSEQKQSFMMELDLWTEANIIGRVFNTDPNQDNWEDVVAEVKKAIRAKVLESYHNGQEACPRTQQQRRPYARR